MDQTGFNQNQLLNQEHPDHEEQLQAQQEAEQQAALAAQQSEPNKKLFIIGGIIGAVVLVIVLVLVFMVIDDSNTNGGVAPTAPPVSLPTNPPREKTEFGQKLDDLEEQIDSVDPSDFPIDPPPLNYNIRL